MAAILKRWTGSAWVAKPIKYWTGSAWVEKPLKYWNGSAWIGPAVATTYADNFNRADAYLEASPVASGGWSWVHDGLIAQGLSVYSNVLYSGITDTVGTAYKTPSVGSANHYVQYKVPSGLVGVLGQTVDAAFVCARFADRGNFVGVHVGNGGGGNGQVEVASRVGTSGWTRLVLTPGGTVTIGDTLRLECSGTTWTLKKNGAVLNSGGFDASLTSSGTGIIGRSLVCELAEDFEAGKL